MGPEAARRCLLHDVDETVTYRSSQGLRKHKGQGLDYVLERIGEKHNQMEFVSHRILATAACGVDDTFFALIEYKYKSKQPNDDRIRTGYKIMEMDVMYDDTVLKAFGIHERDCLAADDLSAVAQKGSAATTSDATPFPEDDLAPYPQGLSNETALLNQQVWCQARSSGQPEELLDKALDPSFKLWDAFEVLPVLCDPTRAAAQPDACCVKYDSVKDIVRQTKERYDIKYKLIDNAVSLNKNAGFIHWCSRVINRDTKDSFEVEALEVDLFGADGRLKDVWVFRDPMDTERAMLQGQT
jgi:hypothetical protein